MKFTKLLTTQKLQKGYEQYAVYFCCFLFYFGATCIIRFDYCRSIIVSQTDICYDLKRGKDDEWSQIYKITMDLYRSKCKQFYGIIHKVIAHRVQQSLSGIVWCRASYLSVASQQVVQRRERTRKTWSKHSNEQGKQHIEYESEKRERQLKNTHKSEEKIQTKTILLALNVYKAVHIQCWHSNIRVHRNKNWNNWSNREVNVESCSLARIHLTRKITESVVKLQHS